MSEALIRIVYDHLPPIEVKRHTETERGDIFTLVTPIDRWGIHIPAGFQSDGASVPRAFWGLVFPQDDLSSMYAAFFHDYLYRTHPKGWTRKDADEEFLFLLKLGDVPTARATMAYFGVRLFGAIAWNQGGKYKSLTDSVSGSARTQEGIKK